MIRLIQRRLIIPRGDTGTFTVPVIATKNTGDVAVFSIIDNMTAKKVFEKIVQVSGDTMTIEFSHNETVNLPVGKYVWDIKFYQNPEFADGALINGVEVDSYYAAFTMPICEIRQTGDNLLMADDAPGTELSASQLDILNATVNETNAAKNTAVESASTAFAAASTATENAATAVASAEEATAALNELKEILPSLAEVATSGSYEDLEDKPFIPSRVSDLTDDSGHYTKPANGIPASDLEETYLTEHQDLSNYVQKTDYATASIGGSVKVNSNYGIKISENGELQLAFPSDSVIKTGTNDRKTIPVSSLHTGVFYGLAKAAGDTTQSQSNNAVGTYTDSAKTAIQTMLDVPSNVAMTTAIGNAIGNINSFDMAVVQELPTQNISTHTIYLVPKTGETNDVYDEYVYINNAWEMVGNTQIDLSNYVQKTDYATANNAGVVKIMSNSGGGIDIVNQYLRIAGATDAYVKSGSSAYRPLTPSIQHTSTFYGLAKAAGDTTQSQSANAVGTYTDEAKAAIQQMLDVPSTGDIPDTSIYATKADTVLETTLSRGRKAGTTVGTGSIAFGINVEASGAYSTSLGMMSNALGNYSKAEGYKTTSSGNSAHAEGNSTIASGRNAHSEGTSTTASAEVSHSEGTSTIASGTGSHSEGYGTQANACLLHAEGRYNQSATIYPEWAINTEYVVGDKVTHYGIGYICTANNSDAEWNNEHWQIIYHNSDKAFIVGNGIADARSNAYALDWDGNGHYMGDVYVHANADSTGGTKLATIEDIPDVPVQDVQVNGVSVLTDGVANVPVASTSQYGAMMVGPGLSTMINGGNTVVCASFATGSDIKKGKSTTGLIRASHQHESTFYGLAKAAGADEKDSTLPVGEYTDTAKSAIRTMLGAASDNIIAISDTAPTDPDTKIWIPETATSVQVPTVSEMETALAGKVGDVQVAGTSVVGSDGVAAIPLATSSQIGVVSVGDYGISVSGANNTLVLSAGAPTETKTGTNIYRPVVVGRQHQSVFYGLSKVAGVDLANETVTLGQYPEASKIAIKAMLGVEEGLKVVRLI